MVLLLDWARWRVGAATLALVMGAVSTAWGQFDTLIETGDSSNRVDIFYMGDGYTAADLASGVYTTHVNKHLNYMFSNSLATDPYHRYRNFFNAYAINVVSNESGVDVPSDGIFKDTALGASYGSGTVERLITVNLSAASTALNTALAGSGKFSDVRMVTVNESIYGGGANVFGVYAGGHADAGDVAVHEMAHAFHGLADEYQYNTNTTYTGSEPFPVNVTADASGSKWSHWLGYSDPTGGVVGAYEGARYVDHGLYRPTLDSKMRSLNAAFNAVSREKIILDIYAKVDPLDSHTPNALTLTDPALLTADTVDDGVIDTQWFIDSLYDPTLDGLTELDIDALGLTGGGHTIGLRAFDPTGFDPVNGWVRINTDRLEQFVDWNVLITVPEPASVLLLVVGMTACVGTRSGRRSTRAAL